MMIKAAAQSKGMSRGTGRVGGTLGWNLGSQEPNEDSNGAPWSAGLTVGEGAAFTAGSSRRAARGQTCVAGEGHGMAWWHLQGCVLLAGDKLKIPGGGSRLSLGISKEWGPAGDTSSLSCCLVPGTKGAQALSQKVKRVAFPAELLRSRL